MGYYDVLGFKRKQTRRLAWNGMFALEFAQIGRKDVPAVERGARRVVDDSGYLSFFFYQVKIEKDRKGIQKTPDFIGVSRVWHIPCRSGQTTLESRVCNFYTVL